MYRILTALALCAGLALTGCTDSALTDVEANSAVNDAASLGYIFLDGPDTVGENCTLTYTMNSSGANGPQPTGAGTWSVAYPASISSTGLNAYGQAFARVSTNRPRPSYFTVYWTNDSGTATYSKFVSYDAAGACDL